MSEAMRLPLALFAGILLGVMFFGGLWWTVLKGVASPRPALWFFGSLLLRTGIALAGFYFVSGADWKRMLVCLLGFVIARIIITRLTAMPVSLSPNSLDGTTSHSTRLQESAAKSLVIPPAGERDAVSLREFHVNEADHAP